MNKEEIEELLYFRIKELRENDRTLSLAIYYLAKVIENRSVYVPNEIKVRDSSFYDI